MDESRISIMDDDDDIAIESIVAIDVSRVGGDNDALSAALNTLDMIVDDDNRMDDDSS